MSSILSITELKERILNNEAVKSSILKRHQSHFDTSGNISFENDTATIIFSLAPLFFTLTAILLFFNSHILPSFLFFVTGSALGILSMHHCIDKTNKQNMLVHEDFIDISEVMSKEELQMLIDFYEAKFYKDDENKEAIYKFNLCDLMNPLDFKDAPEEAQIINKHKRDAYLDSVYKK